MCKTFHLPCNYLTSLLSLVQLARLFPGSLCILPFSLWHNKYCPCLYFQLLLSISNGSPEFYRPPPKETARPFFPSPPCSLHRPVNAISTRHHILVFIYSFNRMRIIDPSSPPLMFKSYLLYPNRSFQTLSNCPSMPKKFCSDI